MIKALKQVQVEKPQFADLSIESGCPLCSGALQIRAAPGSVWSYCPQCRWLSKPVLGISGQQLSLAHFPARA